MTKDKHKWDLTFLFTDGGNESMKIIKLLKKEERKE